MHVGRVKVTYQVVSESTVIGARSISRGGRSVNIGVDFTNVLADIFGLEQKALYNENWGNKSENGIEAHVVT